MFNIIWSSKSTLTTALLLPLHSCDLKGGTLHYVGPVSSLSTVCSNSILVLSASVSSVQVVDELGLQAFCVFVLQPMYTTVLSVDCKIQYVIEVNGNMCDAVPGLVCPV